MKRTPTERVQEARRLHAVADAELGVLQMRRTYGPFEVDAGVPTAYNDDEVVPFFLVKTSGVTAHNSGKQTTTTEIVALLDARHHFNRWVNGEVKNPLPTSEQKQ